MSASPTGHTDIGYPPPIDATRHHRPETVISVGALLTGTVVERFELPMESQDDIEQANANGSDSQQVALVYKRRLTGGRRDVAPRTH